MAKDRVATSSSSIYTANTAANTVYNANAIFSTATNRVYSANADVNTASAAAGSSSSTVLLSSFAKGRVELDREKGFLRMDRGSMKPRKGKNSRRRKKHPPQRGLGVAQLEKLRLLEEHNKTTPANNNTSSHYTPWFLKTFPDTTPSYTPQGTNFRLPTLLQAAGNPDIQTPSVNGVDRTSKELSSFQRLFANPQTRYNSTSATSSTEPRNECDYGIILGKAIPFPETVKRQAGLVNAEYEESFSRSGPDRLVSLQVPKRWKSSEAEMEKKQKNLLNPLIMPPADISLGLRSHSQTLPLLVPPASIPPSPSPCINSNNNSPNPYEYLTDNNNSNDDDQYLPSITLGLTLSLAANCSTSSHAKSPYIRTVANPPLESFTPARSPTLLTSTPFSSSFSSSSTAAAITTAASANAGLARAFFSTDRHRSSPLGLHRQNIIGSPSKLLRWNPPKPQVYLDQTVGGMSKEIAREEKSRLKTLFPSSTLHTNGTTSTLDLTLKLSI